MVFSKEPLVSIIVPTFNRRRWIGECLDSALGQTYRNTEIIVVDDESTDDTVEWLSGTERYNSVRLLVQEKNGGASLARNRGVSESKGELIVFIDSDDLLLPNHVEKAVKAFLDFPDLGLFCCDSEMIDDQGRKIANGETWHEVVGRIKQYPVETAFRDLEDVFVFSNCFPGFTIDRSVFDELGGFDQSVFPADDYDLALRVAGSRHKLFYLHEPLCLRREHDGQLSGVRNSVKTCVKLSEALERVVARPEGRKLDSSTVRRRLAELSFEKGLSEINQGSQVAGVGTILRSMLKDPPLVSRAAKMVVSKVRSLARSKNGKLTPLG